MGFGVQTSPVGPGTKPQQGSDDGVGSLGESGSGSVRLGYQTASDFTRVSDFQVLKPGPD